MTASAVPVPSDNIYIVISHSGEPYEDWPEDEQWREVDRIILEPFGEYTQREAIVLKAPDGTYWEGDVSTHYDYGTIKEWFTVRQVEPVQVIKTEWKIVKDV